MRRHLGHAEAKRVHSVIHRALDEARAAAQEAGSTAGVDLLSVDWEVADAAYRWGAALLEELAPGPARQDEPGGAEDPDPSEGQGSGGNAGSGPHGPNGKGSNGTGGNGHGFGSVVPCSGCGSLLVGVDPLEDGELALCNPCFRDWAHGQRAVARGV